MTHIPRSLQGAYAPLSVPPTKERPLHVVLACTGSVASIKVPLMAERLVTQYAHVHVYVVATTSSRHFFSMPRTSFTVHDLAEMNRTGVQKDQAPRVHVWTDEDEWQAWQQMGDPVLHIELRRWADLVLIAPCGANTLAKLSQGLCDNVLTSMMRAVSPATPVWVFPAMNTLMYLHPLTAQHIKTIESFGYKVYGPISKRLACGDMGEGAMYEWTAIVEKVAHTFALT